MYYLMSISTIATKQKTMPDYLLYIFGIIGIGLIVFFGGSIIKNLDKFKQKAGLNIAVLGESADVHINDKFMGKTPYSDEKVKPGTNKITIKRGDRQYQTSIDFLPNEGGVIHYVGLDQDLGTSDTFSSGSEFWFEKDTSGNVLRVISDPSGAKVFIDNSEVGVTPFVSSNISDADYEIKISAEGYETQTSRITVKKGYTLNATFKMFPIPVPQKIVSSEGSKNLYEITPQANIESVTPQEWVKAVIYWNTSRGLNIEGTGENKDQYFDVFLSYKGDIFNKNGDPVVTKDELAAIRADSKIGYLGRSTDTAGLTEEAKETLKTLLGTVSLGKQAKILSTPTGWLRVRSEPSLDGAEITKIDAGGTYPVLEEQSSWTKIRVSDTSEGWVSSDYVELVE